MQNDIFISYSREDKDIVLPLIDKINKEVGTQCWIDLDGIKSGEEYENIIIKNIEESKVVLFMLSDASLKSNWTQREVYYAESEGKRIVPVVIDGEGLRDWFKFHFLNVDYIDVRSNEQKNKLIKNLKSWLNIDTQKSEQRFQISPNEQYLLGYDYYYGKNGKQQNFVEAAEWYLKSAEQGYAPAQFKLGVMYDYGKGINQDKKKAVEWYRKAAEQGIVCAQFNLGSMYDKGEGVNQDKKKAVEWYRTSAEKGYAPAQCNLGIMYHYGKGINQDKKKAVEWYRKAAEQGDDSAQYLLGVKYKTGIGVSKNLKEAESWFKKAADQGHKQAINELKNLWL